MLNRTSSEPNKTGSSGPEGRRIANRVPGLGRSARASTIRMQLVPEKQLMAPLPSAGESVGRTCDRQSDSWPGLARWPRCQNGIRAFVTRARSAVRGLPVARVLAVGVLVAAVAMPQAPGAAAPQSEASPPLELALRQGEVVRATALDGSVQDGFTASLPNGRLPIAGADLIAVHGVAARPVELAAVWLQGGDVVRGTLTGGDAAGNVVRLLSPVLGPIELEVDRIAAYVPRGGGSDLTPARLELPDGVDEALFVRARIGYDLRVGRLHRFDPQGLRFALDDSDDPQLYREKAFVALRIGDPAPRERAPIATLVTRTGDRLGCDAVTFGAASVRIELETGRTVDVRYGDLGCLTLHGNCRHLSELQPSAAVENGFDGPVVHPYRRNATALGGPLVASDRTHAMGLGVHSKSRLTFTVPPDCEAFWTRVALDDSAAALPLRANVDVRVLHNGITVFEQRGLETGDRPRDTGLIAVTPGMDLVLEVDFGKGRDLGDRVDWLTPVFLPAPSR